LFGWLLRRPLHAGIIVGVIVAAAFGLFAFPNEDSVEKSIVEWLPEDGVSSEAEINSLIAALEDARAGNGTLERVSVDEFRDLELEESHAFATPRSDAFAVEYVGRANEDAGTVYVAEQEVYAAPWWHPDRLLYKAADHHIDSFGNGLRLSYERDWDGLGALLILDAILGIVYGGLVSVILAVAGGNETSIPSGSRDRRLPAETPISTFRGKTPVNR
jgi:hypothetical protein